jgi:hypothetical protein
LLLEGVFMGNNGMDRTSASRTARQIAKWRSVMQEKGLETVLKEGIVVALRAAGPEVRIRVLALSLYLGDSARFSIWWYVLTAAVGTAVAAGIFEKGRSHDDPKVRRASAWGGSIADAVARSGEAYEEFLRRANDPSARESIEESFNAAVLTLGPEQAECMANLGCLYALEGKGPDQFFRQVGSLLKRCSAEDVDALRKLLAPLKPPVEVEQGRLELRPMHYTVGATAFIPRVNTPPTAVAQDQYNAISLFFRGAQTPSKITCNEPISMNDPLKIVALLKTDHLARDVTEGATMNLADAFRLERVLRRDR